MGVGVCAGVMIWDSSFFYPVLPLFSQKKSGVVIENKKVEESRDLARNRGCVTQICEKSSGLGGKKISSFSRFLCLPQACVSLLCFYTNIYLNKTHTFKGFYPVPFQFILLKHFFMKNPICRLFQAFPTLESSSLPSTRWTTRPRPSGRCAGSSRCTWWWPSPRWTRRSAGHSGPWTLGPQSSSTGPPG